MFKRPKTKAPAPAAAPSTAPNAVFPTPTGRSSRGAPLAAQTVMRLLGRLRNGSLDVHWPDHSHTHCGQRGSAAASGHVAASLHIHHWRVCAQALRSGDIGFAESYLAGDWTTPDLTALLRVLVQNRRELDDMVFGSWWGGLAYRLRHLLNRNHKANSRKNIHAHYDLGNAFYTLWLDDTMNYSSALYESADTPMREAQRAKVRRALRMVDTQPGHRVLEIGCGWGALAEMATTEFQASTVGVTLSTEQLAWAKERLARLGVMPPGQANPAAGPAPATSARAPTAELRLQDYRDIGVTTSDPPFDAICSIEMLEAVGREYWPTYFQTVARLLKPGGLACIQTITIADDLFERYLRSADFIQQYIFPGGCLPCKRVMREQARAAGLEVVDEFAFGQDYARTLATWREQFVAEQARVLALGFDQRFLRIWTFYLAYCEAAFTERNTDVLQFTLRKPA
jgi:cyclopropane-fatty-acyl-phospholipid synthase